MKNAQTKNPLERFIDHPVFPWISLLLFGAFLLLFRNARDSLWYDESYSAVLTRHSFFRIIPLIGDDSHPPLYFLLLKIWTVLFGRSVFALRSFSALGILLLASLGFYPLKKVADQRTGLLFSFLVFITPMSIIQGQEIRMYGWTAFCVTAAVLFGILAFREKDMKYWVATGVFSLAAAYTHYFGFMAVCCFHLLFLIAILVKQRDQILRYGIMAGALILSYLPWYFFLHRQMARVGRQYWIPPVTFQKILGVLTYPYDYKFYPSPFGVWAALFAAGLIITGIVLAILKNKKSLALILSPLIVLFLTLASALVLSALFRPILMERYMVSCLGLFILSLTFSVSQLKGDVTRRSMLAILLVFSALTLVPFYRNTFNGPLNQIVDELKDDIGPDDIFIHTSEHNMGTFSYYFPDNFHYLYWPDDAVPFSNYEIFTLNGGYGGDYRQFLEDTNNIWITERIGEPSRLDLTEFYLAEHFQAVNPARTFSTEPGGYSVNMKQFEFVQKKELSGKSDYVLLDVQVSGIRNIEGSMLCIVVYNDLPMEESEPVYWNLTAIDDGKGRFVVPDLVHDSYSVLIYQDINANYTLDFRTTGYPSEGVAVSGRADLTSLETFRQEDTVVNLEQSLETMILKMVYFDSE